MDSQKTSIGTSSESSYDKLDINLIPKIVKSWADKLHLVIQKISICKPTFLSFGKLNLLIGENMKSFDLYKEHSFIKTLKNLNIFFF